MSQLPGPMFPVGKDLAGLLRQPPGRDTSVLPESDQQAPTPPVPDGQGGALSVNLRREWLRLVQSRLCLVLFLSSSPEGCAAKSGSANGFCHPSFSGRL